MIINFLIGLPIGLILFALICLFMLFISEFFETFIGLFFMVLWGFLIFKGACVIGEFIRNWR
jgi:hypothetical protein